MNGPSFRVENNPACPGCSTRLDACSAVGHDKRPEPGDPTVCVYCGAVLRFTPAMGLELVPRAVWAAWHPETVAMLESIERNCKRARN